MTQYWKKTKDLFSNIITEPPLTENHLKSPTPKFMFLLIKNTMEKTGFPKGLFTPEEETIKYFSSDIEHKKCIFKKVIDITRLVTKTNFTIDIEKLIQGLEGEKTNIFLQYFYKASTTNIDTKSIINKYLKDMKINKKLKENDKSISVEKIIQKKKEENNLGNNHQQNPEMKVNDKCENIINKMIINEKIEAKGYIFWIDQNVFSSENRSYLQKFKENPLYKNLLLSLQFICFNNLNFAFNTLLRLHFKIIFIIISGRLYPYYYNELNKHKKFINFLPICVIFTSDKKKEILIKRKKEYYLTEDIFDSINNSFYNLGGVSSNFDYCINFIINCYNSFISLPNKNYLNKNEKRNYDGCLTFECIYSNKQLILPFLYNELMLEEKVSDNEIHFFKNFLLINYNENEIANLFLPLLYIKEIPHEIIAKYFLRAYTEETSFCYEMNRLLMKKKRRRL